MQFIVMADLFNRTISVVIAFDTILATAEEAVSTVAVVPTISTGKVSHQTQTFGWVYAVGIANSLLAG
jgi:hypothetical protein